MMPGSDDIRRLNPSSTARWDACAGDVLPLHSLETRHQTLGRDAARMKEIQFEEALAAQRKLSPRFPDIVEALQRRRNDERKLAARIMFGLGLISLIATPFADHPGWCFASSVACGIGFAVICWCSALINKKRMTP